MGGTASLSQMTDPYTKLIPMACAIEVKETSGSREEATIQFGVWAAAGLAKVRGLFNGATLLQPFLGWTVVGHNWMLYMSWKLDNREVVSLRTPAIILSIELINMQVVCGPWKAFDAGTDTYRGIFKLLHLIAEVGQWLQKEYWTWFSDGIVKAEQYDIRGRRGRNT